MPWELEKDRFAVRHVVLSPAPWPWSDEPPVAPPEEPPAPLPAPPEALPVPPEDVPSCGVVEVEPEEEPLPPSCAAAAVVA
jgi:hypothetical protein